MGKTHNIPLVDLKSQHDEIQPQFEAAIRDVIEESAFVGGSYVEKFERDFSDYCGSRETVACSSGTEALRLALKAVGVEPGDEVITVPFTFIATVEAITQIGAHPVFVDLESETSTLDPEKLASFLENHCRRTDDGRTVNLATSRTVAAIIPVHLYGFPADMAPILVLAKEFGLKVIEDACQAHGALYYLEQAEKHVSRDNRHQSMAKGRRAGTLGDAGCFSFYPSKNLGAMGDAGAFVTQDPAIAERARILRDHGQRERYIHVSPDGWNGRLDGIQAAILSIKLRRLDGWNDQRRQVANWYHERLIEWDIPLPVERDYGRHVYHLYVIRLRDRDRVREAIAECGIATGLHYPIPLHLQEAYKYLGHDCGDYPISEMAARSVLSLPMYPHLTEEQVDYICNCLIKALNPA